MYWYMVVTVVIRYCIFINEIVLHRGLIHTYLRITCILLATYLPSHTSILFVPVFRKVLWTFPELHLYCRHSFSPLKPRRQIPCLRHWFSSRRRVFLQHKHWMSHNRLRQSSKQARHPFPRRLCYRCSLLKKRRIYGSSTRTSSSHACAPAMSRLPVNASTG